MRVFVLFFLLIFAPFSTSVGQGKYIVKNKKGVERVNFKLLNNLIILPVTVNGVELSFVLDSGVSRPIVFNFYKESDSINIIDAEKIYLKGLGKNGLVPALKSSHNTFNFEDVVNYNQDFYTIFDASINFAPKLGVPVHGIIGFDLFKDLIVEINYSNKYIKLTDPKKHKYKRCKKCEFVNLEFYKNKPYLNSEVIIKDKKVPVKLLIDTGSSDALWLFEDDSLGIVETENYFKDLLGHGLSGEILGKRSKIEGFSIKNFILNNPLVSYPDASYIELLKKIEGRNGSLGGEILKRFNVVIDYGNAKMRLKPNSNFKKKFSYNKSGIEVENAGVRLSVEYEREQNTNNLLENDNENVKVYGVYARTKRYVVNTAYKIANIRPDSPGAKAGLLKGDKILFINGKDTLKMTLQELIHRFYGEEGDKVRLQIDRNGVLIKVVFKLESLLN